MKARKQPDRSNQRRRTRKDLLDAAAKLLRDGQNPSMEAIAGAALVSRATAYRYFPNVEALLIEAPLDTDVPDADTLFANNPSTDPEERVDRAEAAIHEMSCANEAQLRLMLAHSLTRSTMENQGGEGGRASPVPIRQNRRSPVIEAALAPSRDRLTSDSYDRLSAALALLFGPEALVVFRDVLQTDMETARMVKSWAARALVRAALAESEGRTGDRHDKG